MNPGKHGYAIVDLGKGRVGIVFDINQEISSKKGEVVIAKTPPSGEFIAIDDERFVFMRLEITEPAEIRNEVKRALRG